MTELFVQNNHIINQRWPEIAQLLLAQSIDQLDAQLVTATQQTISVDGIQLSSRYNRLAEAQLMIGQVNEDATNISVYGLGMGDVPSLLIDIKELESITVLPLNFALLALLLSYTDQTEWLSHPKVTLSQITDQQIIANDYIAITPDLQLASDENAVLRDLLVYELNREYTNQRHQADSPALLQRIKENIDIIKFDPDINSLKKYHQNNDAFIIATGPTLEQHYPFLKSLMAKPVADRALIIAVDTALVPLLSNGISPDIVVTLDQNITSEHLPNLIPETIKLVYFPTTPNAIISTWKGMRFNAYSTSKNFDHLQLSIPKSRLFANGSVLHPAVDLAVKLNCKTVSLFGCDFSYPNHKTHAQWENGKLGPKAELAKHWVINGHGDKASTHLSFRAYLRSLEMYIRNQASTNFIQTSLDSAAILGVTFKEYSK
ncbi:motility associated factor glycosyltransferase family protein [Shewanella sp. TC10]|uniref:motility associated factor glycosyltransferase family protein n=1 Tax=Shewanella sp. TC10 TaxID=1419739 RepID=UPI00129E01AE|nr:6-hydroxymethylpterin diphosphokinase MptE-like protein [Shewanella sp. TC10]